MFCTFTRGTTALVALVALALAGCTAEPAPANTTGTGGGGTGREGGLIAVITPSHANPFFKTEADAAVAKAVELGYETASDSHNDDANTQSQLIDSAISRNAAAIILDNAGADSTIGAVRKAVDAGVPVFLIDREINERGIATSQIVADNAQGAAIVAAEFARALGGEGTYIELLGRETDTNAQVRSTAFHSVLDQYSGLTMVGQDTANWDQQEAFTKVETLLQQHPDVTGIIAGNDTMAVGAVAAVQAAGRGGDVVIAGFDGSPDAVAAIQAGQMLATGMQPAVAISEMAVEQADAYIRTGTTGLPEKQAVNCLLINADNADRYTLFALEG